MNDGMTNDERSSVLRLPFSDQPFPRPARHERGEGRGEGHVTIFSRRGAEARRFLSRSRRGQEADPEPVTAAFKLRDFSHHEGPEDHEERHTHELIFPQNLVGPSVVVRLLLHLKRKRACTLVFRTADVSSAAAAQRGCDRAAGQEARAPTLARIGTSHGCAKRPGVRPACAATAGRQSPAALICMGPVTGVRMPGRRPAVLPARLTPDT